MNKYNLSVLSVIFFSVLSFATIAQTKTTTSKTGKSKSASGGGAGYKALGGGGSYKIIKDLPGKKAVVGDYVAINITVMADTQVLQSSRKDNMGKPAIIEVKAPSGKTDFVGEILPKLAAGDSAIVRIMMDSIMANAPANQLPPFFHKGGYIIIQVVLVGFKTKEEYTKENEKLQADRQKQMKEQAGKQMSMDDKILQDYFTKNNIHAQKTTSGLYYVISAQGTGENIKKGDKPSINYTGRTLDGHMFDSNTDPAKNHVTPFEFTVGKGMVIQGWDEGVQLMKKGTKATLYIPSPLAYGQRGPSPEIGANAILMFDMEVLDVKSEQ